MANRESTNPVKSQKYESLPIDPPPSYNEVVNPLSLNTADAKSSGNGLMPKPSAPVLEPDPYINDFVNVDQQLCITNAPYTTAATSVVPANNVIKDERVPHADRRRHLSEDDDECCSCDNGCEGCLACMTVCNCILQCFNLILEIAQLCAKS